MKKIIITLILVLYFLPNISIQAKIQFQDAIGRTITLEQPAKKVAIVYNYVEYAAVAGQECYARVVGIGKKAWFNWRKGIWDEYVKICPEIEKIEDIGLLRFGDFYIEKFIALKADILILPKWQYEAIDNTLKKKFEKAKVVLIVTDYANQQLETHINSTLAIGHAIGKLDRAKKITKYYEKQFNFVTDRIKKTVKRPSAYIEKGQKGAQIIDDTWSMVVWGAMLNTAGGKNIADGVIKKGKHGQLTREKILSSNPDYIFITGSNWVKSHNSLLMGYSVEKKEANQRLKTFSLRKGWNKLKAIKNDNLYAMHHGLARSLMDFSAIQFIAKKLHPEIFEDLDVMARLEEFHSKFLPVKFKGTWFLQIANE